MWPNPKFFADLVTFTEEILNKNVIFCAVFPADLVTFTEEIPNGKLHFLCSDPAEQNH